jgi:hypothetical protein
MTELFADVAEPVAAVADDLEPQSVSGRQDWSENHVNRVNRVIWSSW